MEQSGVSIIAPPGITDNSVGKSKSIGITFRTNPTIQAAKEKLKTPCKYPFLTGEVACKSPIRAEPAPPEKDAVQRQADRCDPAENRASQVERRRSAGSSRCPAKERRKVTRRGAHFLEIGLP